MQQVRTAMRNGPGIPPQAVDALQASCTVHVLARRRLRLERWSVQDGSRPFWRLYWNPQPGAWMSRGRRRIDLDPDRWVLIAPHTSYRGGLDQPTEHCYVHCLLGHPYDGLGPLISEHRLDVSTTRLLQQLFTPERAGAAAWHLPPLMALIGTALAGLPRPAWPRLPLDERIDAVCRALAADPARNWRNAELAGLAAMSPTAFNRRFRQITGTSPQAHLLHLRIDRARILLEHSNDSIEAIADACGYATRSHFSTVFTRAAGCGPAAYRQQCSS